MGEGTEHWTGEYTEGPLSTPEAKTALGKYDTKDAAIVGGLEAQKQVGKPYKLPESMDKLADDTARGEFRSGALKVLGSIDNVEAMKDFDYSIGRREGYELTEADTAVATMFAQHVVDTKMPESMAKQNIEFYNKVLEQAQVDADNKYIAQSEATDAKLNEIMNGKENVVKNSELIKRMFQNDAGLSAEEFGEIADGLVELKYVHSTVMIKALSNLAQKVTAEGVSGDGGGGSPGGNAIVTQTPYEAKKARWPKSESQWGGESDTWDSQSVETKRIFGYGKKEDKK